MQEMLIKINTIKLKQTQNIVINYNFKVESKIFFFWGGRGNKNITH